MYAGSWGCRAGETPRHRPPGEERGGDKARPELTPAVSVSCPCPCPCRVRVRARVRVRGRVRARVRARPGPRPCPCPCPCPPVSVPVSFATVSALGHPTAQPATRTQGKITPKAPPETVPGGDEIPAGPGRAGRRSPAVRPRRSADPKGPAETRRRRPPPPRPAASDEPGSRSAHRGPPLRAARSHLNARGPARGLRTARGGRISGPTPARVDAAVTHNSAECGAAERLDTEPPSGPGRSG